MWHFADLRFADPIFLWLADLKLQQVCKYIHTYINIAYNDLTKICTKNRLQRRLLVLLWDTKKLADLVIAEWLQQYADFRFVDFKRSLLAHFCLCPCACKSFLNFQFRIFCDQTAFQVLGDSTIGHKETVFRSIPNKKTAYKWIQFCRTWASQRHKILVRYPEKAEANVFEEKKFHKCLFRVWIITSRKEVMMKRYLKLEQKTTEFERNWSRNIAIR